MDGSLMTVAPWIEATDDDEQEAIPVHGTTIQANQIEQPTTTDTYEHLQHPPTATNKQHLLQELPTSINRHLPTRSHAYGEEQILASLYNMKK